MSKFSMSRSVNYQCIWQVVLCLAIFATGNFYYNHTLQAQQQAESRKNDSMRLAAELRQSSDDLTRMVRTYAVTGNASYKQYFQDILDIRNGMQPRPYQLGDIYWDFANENYHPAITLKTNQGISLIALMEIAGITEDEFNILKQAKSASDQLTKTEFDVIRSIDANPGMAERLRIIQLLHNPAYHLAKAEIMKSIHDFTKHVEARTANEIEALKLKSTISLMTLILAGGYLVWHLMTLNHNKQNHNTHNKKPENTRAIICRDSGERGQTKFIY